MLKKHLGIIIFSAVYIIFCFATYKLIPIGNGEEFRYLRGKETLTHLTSNSFKDDLLQPKPHYFLYNLYPMLLVLLNPKFYYEWFHLGTMLFGLLIFVGTYLLTFELTKNTKLAMFAVGTLVLIPNFFGQIGINPIDIPFAALYLACVLALYYLRFEPYNPKKLLILGLLFGVTQGMRQPALSLYILLPLLDLFQHNNILKNIGNYILIFIVANFVMLVTWPNFAINYFKSFYWYLFIGQNFYLWHYGLLFMGKILTNDMRPVYYLPLLQLITQPIFVTATFIIALTRSKLLAKHELGFLVLCVLGINYLLYFVLHPVLYDGIRHFIYLLPFLAALSAYALGFLPKVAWLLIGIEVILILSYTIKNFPYQYAYYNQLGNLLGNPTYLFETDYSSLVYKKSSEWVRDEFVDTWDKTHDKMLKVYACDNGYAVDYYSHKKFLTVINKEDADLIICDYRQMLKDDYFGAVLHTDQLNGQDINFVINPKTMPL